jgi:hypothetical protein
VGERVKGLVIEWLRFAESCFPIPLLVLLLFPAAAVMATHELLMGKDGCSTLRQLRQFLKNGRRSGAQWRRCSLGEVWAGRLAMCMARFVCCWPEQLREPRWSRRCQFIGVERLEAILAERRPVVLATFHYGNLPELYHWVRSRGIGVAFLASRDLGAVPTYRSRLDSLADRANGLEGVPRLIGIGHLHLWGAREFLAVPNRVLAIAIEGRTKRDISVHGSGYTLRMAPGALRLAARARAVVIPCLISAHNFFRSTIRFGEPLPDDLVGCNDRHLLGCEYILREVGPWISTQPEQAAPELISAVNFQES